MWTKFLLSFEVMNTPLSHSQGYLVLCTFCLMTFYSDDTMRTCSVKDYTLRVKVCVCGARAPCSRSAPHHRSALRLPGTYAPRPTPPCALPHCPQHVLTPAAGGRTLTEGCEQRDEATGRCAGPSVPFLFSVFVFRPTLGGATSASTSRVVASCLP